MKYINALNKTFYFKNLSNKIHLDFYLSNLFKGV